MLPLGHRRSNKRLALAAVGVFLGLLGYLGHFFSSTTDPPRSTFEPEKPPSVKEDIQRMPQVPSEYGSPCESADRISPTDVCLDAASAAYLRGLRRNAVEFCSSRSGGVVSSFHVRLHEGEEEHDHGLLIIAQGVVLDEMTKHFAFECADRIHEKEPPIGIFDLAVLRYHWGLGPVFDHYIQLHFKIQDIPKAKFGVEEHEAQQPNYTILVKRERVASFWDSLMEVMSMTLSMDILRMSSDIHLGDSFVKAPTGLPRTQVLILDDLPDGPLYDLWSRISGTVPIRFRLNPEHKTGVDALLSEHTAIIPLPGHSNPLAQIDQQDVSNRNYSALARAFARRVLQNYDVVYPQDGSHISNAVRVTLITWPSRRELRDTDHLLQALRGAFPHVLVRTVDIAAMPMTDQLKIVQSTDVLVGVHGDGLSHIMFMREGEGAVLEIQPAGLSTLPDQARYKNLAAMLGQKYFYIEAEVVPLPRTGWIEIDLSAEKFVGEVGRAIGALGVSREV